MENDNQLVTKKRWDEFRQTGLLFLVNMLLHSFGWAIVMEVNHKNEVIKAFPARVKFRGFSNDVQTEEYKKIGTYIKENAEDICKESFDE